MNIWHIHGQYKASGLKTNEISCNIFYLHHMGKVAAHFQKKKQNIQIFIQVPKQRKWKNIKKRGCRAVFRTLHHRYLIIHP